MAQELPFVTFCNSIPKAETEKVKRKIREVAKEDVEDKLLEACGYLGSYSDACRATVVDNFDAIYRCVLTKSHGEVPQNRRATLFQTGSSSASTSRRCATPSGSAARP